MFTDKLHPQEELGSLECDNCPEASSRRKRSLLAGSNRLTRLNLGHNRLTDLPRAIYSLKELQVLQMNNNQIEIVDEKICEVNMLNNLNLAHNKIKVDYRYFQKSPL